VARSLEAQQLIGARPLLVHALHDQASAKRLALVQVLASLPDAQQSELG
jgi:hypothetical protein